MKERAKLAEGQNSKLHKEIQGLTGRMEREETLLKDAMEDKAAIRAAASSEVQIKSLESKLQEVEAALAEKKDENGDLMKELNKVMNDKEELQAELSSLNEKLEQAEKTRDFALKATKLASQASEATQSEEDKKVVGELLLQKSKLEDSLAIASKKCEDLEGERTKLIEAVKALKNKVRRRRKGPLVKERTRISLTPHRSRRSTPPRCLRRSRCWRSRRPRRRRRTPRPGLSRPRRSRR